MEICGYTCKTTFWNDFLIAEKFGEKAIKDTFKRAFKEWKTNIEYLTEFVMILNWKCWHFYERNNKVISKLYCDLYYKAHNWCCNNLKGDDLKYYLETTD